MPTKKDYVEQPDQNLRYHTTSDGTVPNPEWAKCWTKDALYRGPSPYIYPDYPTAPQPSDIPDANFCWHRLPCGICRLTNTQCPKSTISQPFTQPYVTWDTATPPTKGTTISNINGKTYTTDGKTYAKEDK